MVSHQVWRYSLSITDKVDVVCALRVGDGLSQRSKGGDADTVHADGRLVPENDCMVDSLRIGADSSVGYSAD